MSYPASLQFYTSFRLWFIAISKLIFEIFEIDHFLVFEQYFLFIMYEINECLPVKLRKTFCTDKL